MCRMRNSVCDYLLRREYNLGKSNRRIHKILARLITKCDYEFKRVWSEYSSQRMESDGTFLFKKNYRSCIDCSASEPYPKFMVRKTTRVKIESALITEGFPESLDLPLKGHKICMLALTESNMLWRIDLDSGEVLEEIFLGPPRVKFRNLQWNVVGESITVISNLVQIDRQGNLLTVKELVVMSLMPLKFVCKMAVSRQVFGLHAMDASISVGLVTVMHHAGFVRMYSLEWILNKKRLHNKQLYDQLTDGSQYGKHPSYLTENVYVDEQPPCLFEVQCRDRDVMLTLPPCYYVMWPYKNDDGYCCFSFETHTMVNKGCLSKPSEISTYDDRIALHADDSGRIVHMTNTQLRLLKLECDPSSGVTTLLEDFTITKSCEPQLPKLRVSKAGRILKPRVLPDTVDIPDRTVLTMVYSEELDMIVLLSRQHGDQAVVGFYNNWNGQLLREFNLKEPVEETLERSLCFHLDTLVHIIRVGQGGFECHVYKLKALEDLHHRTRVKR